MQGDFFQVLRKVQKDERSKSSLSRVDNDFYKQLRDYIKDLERSVANDPFGNEQLILNNAQRIATEICEQRESKITKAANNNIYRSFLLFKRDNPQFDLLDTTPLNLTDEEEILYFSLMDALKNHRYRISLDEYTDESRIEEGYEEEEDVDEDDDDAVFVEDSYNDSIESESALSEDLEDEISNTLGNSGDEVLDRLGQIKDAKVITDEKYENIDKQVANQKYAPQEELKADVQVESQDSSEGLKADVQVESQGSDGEVQSNSEESKPDSFVSDNINDLFKDPDSQFVDLGKLEPNYDDDFYNSIAAGSSYAAPSDDDFNMIFAKPKKPKVEETKDLEAENTSIDSNPKADSVDADLGFSSGLDAKRGKEAPAIGFNKSIENSKDNAPKKPVDKTRGGLFNRDEIENTTVVISEDIGEMVGIDGKVYGPFLANDVVILPNITAQILIDNNKASLVKL